MDNAGYDNADTVSAAGVWRALLHALLDRGVRLDGQASAGAAFGGGASLELLAHRTVWPMERPVIISQGRGLGYAFMAAEAAWILSGDNRLSTILPYAAAMARFSDDGRTLTGAYGPPFVDQVPYVVDALASDRGSRQAFISIWRPRPFRSSDTPCTCSLQWLIRGDLLHCVATMRSSDAWTGVPYDVFNFSAMSAFVAIALLGKLRHEASKAERRGGIPLLRLGNLYLTAGSQHLYLKDADAADRIVAADAMPFAFAVAPIELAEFSSTDDLIEHLRAVAGKGGSGHAWLKELS